MPITNYLSTLSSAYASLCPPKFTWTLTKGRRLINALLYCVVLLLLNCLNATSAFAWLYPEHRQIALIAIQNLSPEDRAIMEKLWAEATKNYTNRLTTLVIDPDQGVKPDRLDFASWTAIGGDHSCSPELMLATVLQSNWILKVADIAAQLKIDLANAKNRSQQINAIRNSDIKLQRADAEYATRAGSNNVHFLLARPNVSSDLREYLKACLLKGSPLNALGAYSWFHTSAIEKAAKYAAGNLSSNEKSVLILSALADEAFSLHFLEDSYASGHIAGTWGNASLRKGTHDYYNEKGLEVVSWDGKRMVLRGDAFMRPEDAAVAAATVKLSLEQFIGMASGKLTLDYTPNSSIKNTPDSLNVCTNNVMPARDAELKYLMDVLIKTPVPGLGNGLGEMPRFRSEMGPFIGVSASLNSEGISGGFGQNQTQKGAIGGIEGNVRFGLGLDGVLNEAGDGLAFIQFGWKQNGASSTRFINTEITNHTNSVTAAIPGQSAYNVRMRIPFFLIPGDLIFAAPFVYLFSHKAAANMAVAAGNGGLIPWQSGIATSVGRFQFVLGREVGVSFYGVNTPVQAILIPISGKSATLISYKSTEFDFPFLEYQPFRRSFSQVQSSSFLIQISGGVNVPHSAYVITPVSATVPDLKSVWHVGLRIIFDWRHYL
ncbi:hypothetical protein [Mucilaginibacter agri]|uniref:Uncharacterized protein n=1 Tax=Mucilaginibacter agri TaxID=2695265 RepID=A0A965ZI85_9SPHI|nr:hypothetical protein [Mucilaginibacter agri]NCD71520.1 hypothetical protein [Mucilaginibacter agri]